MKRFVNLANLITSGALAAGFIAVVLTGDGHLQQAAIAVGVAAVFDAGDGIAARRVRRSVTFGGQLDSLADLVAFGVAPAFMMHKLLVHTSPVLAIGTCMIFVVTGAWRLARFGTLRDEFYFEGLPIPVAGVILALAVAITLPVAAAIVLSLGLALLMISSVRVPNLVTLRRLLRGAPRPLPPHSQPSRVRSLPRSNQPAGASQLQARRARQRAQR